MEGRSIYFVVETMNLAKERDCLSRVHKAETFVALSAFGLGRRRKALESRDNPLLEGFRHKKVLQTIAKTMDDIFVARFDTD
jgi:hypothetical protein